MSLAGTHWRADGAAKTPYPSRAEALVAADERARQAGTELNVYRCDFCGSWHMGRPEGRTPG